MTAWGRYFSLKNTFELNGHDFPELSSYFKINCLWLNNKEIMLRFNSPLVSAPLPLVTSVQPPSMWPAQSLEAQRWTLPP